MDNLQTIKACKRIRAFLNKHYFVCNKTEKESYELLNRVELKAMEALKKERKIKNV